MSTTHTGGPAFPSHGSMGEVVHEGMHLRDYFAAKVMQAIRSDYKYMSELNEGAQALQRSHYDAVAFVAYKQADAMLKARDGI